MRLDRRDLQYLFLWRLAVFTSAYSHFVSSPLDLPRGPRQGPCQESRAEHAMAAMAADCALHVRCTVSFRRGRSGPFS